MTENPYIECGKVINTHGCFGGLKLESWCNTPKELTALRRLYLKKGADYIEYKVTKASVFKQFVILTLDTVDTMDLALAMKGQTVYARRKDFHLGKGEYFLADLIGLSVIDADTQKVYGTLSETINRGASDIYVVETPNGERMIPAVAEFIDHVDIEKGIFVRPIEGMLD
ncbi:MAG: 16S rRNA processing protein RimM [Clostridia bacterium]|nr:16S rRNA processing protein RimM [Clostridia bacterium]